MRVGESSGTGWSDANELWGGIDALEPRLLMAATLPGALPGAPKLLLLRTGGSDANEGSAANPGDLTFLIKRKGNAALLARKSTVFVRTTELDTAAAAVAGVDFQAVNRKLVFKPRQKSLTVNVPVLGDDVEEDDKAVGIELANPKKAKIKVGSAQGTILDDDGDDPPPPPDDGDLPKIEINDIAKSEGSNGSDNFVFTVTLDKTSNQTITVKYNTSNGSATTADNDYDASSGTLTFAPGEIAKFVNVTFFGDTKFEGDENFFVNLFQPTNAVIADNQGFGVILNDDAPPGPADLAIQGTSKVDVNFDAGLYTVTLSVKNNGQTIAAASDVRFELRGISQEPSTVVLFEANFPAVDPGETRTIPYLVDPDPVFNLTDFPELWVVLEFVDATPANNTMNLGGVPTGENLNNPV